MTGKSKIFLGCFFLFFLISVYFFSRLEYQESLLVIMPEKMQREAALFHASPVSQKFFIVVETKDAHILPQAVEIVLRHAQEIPAIQQTEAAGADYLLSYYYHLPNIWDAELEAAASALCTPEAIREKMRENIMRLMGPEGAFFGGFILADPLGLLSLITPYLERLNVSDTVLNFENGYLVSEDGASALLMFDALEDALDRVGAVALTDEVKAINQFLPAGARAFSMGAARYTQENNEVITNDVKRVLVISLVFMTAIFLIFFRKRNALFIYAVPVLVLIPSVVFTWLVLGAGSGITLGFGAVLMGLAIDYSIYIYYAFKASSKNSTKSSVVKAMLRPIILSAATSILTFTALYFCGIPLLKQIGFFAVTGLLFALFIAFAVAPLMFRLQERAERDFRLPIHDRPALSLLLIALILIAGALSLPFVEMDTALNSYNTVSGKFQNDKEIFDALTGNAAQSSSLLFVFGQSQDEALLRSRLFSDAAGVELPLSKILVPSETAARNKERWLEFWNRGRRASVENVLRAEAAGYGLRDSAFNDFFSFVSTASPPPGAEEFDLTRIYNPFIVFEGRAAVLHALGGDIAIPDQFEKDIVLVSQSRTQGDLVYNVMSSLFMVVGVVFILSFILFRLAFRDMRLVALVFAPALCSVAMIVFVSAIFGVPLNLFSLFCIPLLIGLNVDYAIFIIHQKLHSRDLHPSRAVIATALLSVAGFGALVFADHKVLFTMGFTLNIGIITALLVSVYLLPALIRKSKNIAALLLIVLVTGCGGASGVPVRYNAPAGETAAAQTREYHGELGGQAPFTAVFAGRAGPQGPVGQADRVRAVTLNDFGIKLADMTVSAGAVDVHFYMSFLPKRIIRSLALFYRAFLFDRGSLKKTEGGAGAILYTSADDTVALWAGHDDT